MTSATDATTSLDARIAAVSRLSIPAGTILSVRHETSPTVIAGDQRLIERVPPRTEVKVVLHPAPGSTIHVEMWLPDPETWNGRMLGLGNGGAAGRIDPAGLAWALQGAYAVVTTDLGTAPNADSGIDNPEVWKDFGFRATHQMTLVGKQIVKAFYGQAQQYAYFSGSSTGGQQALQTAQRYPDDYDGIVAAIPAHCRTPLHAYFLWNYQILHACPFTAAQQQQVIEAGIAHMADRESPITAGTIVSDPRCVQKDIEAVIALAMQKDPSLTPAHADALRKLFDGPRSSVTGARIFNGLPIGSSFHGASDNLYLFKWVFGRHVDLLTLNFGKDIDTYTAALGPYLNAENPDLSAFKKRGGKLIMTSGSADPVVPFHGTLDYYDRVIAHFGSLDQVTPFFRYYLIPGMAHGGGPGINQPPDMLQVVRNWREHGTIPDPLQGQHVADGTVEWQLPLYAYPTQAHWDAAANTFVPIDGPRGGVEPMAAQFLPPPAE